MKTFSILRLLLLAMSMVTTRSLPLGSDEPREAMSLDQQEQSYRSSEISVDNLIKELKNLQIVIQYQGYALLKKILDGHYYSGDIDAADESLEITGAFGSSAGLALGKDKQDELQQLLNLAKKHTRNPPGKRVQEPMLDPRTEEHIKWAGLNVQSENDSKKPEGQTEQAGVKGKQPEKEDIIFLVAGAENRLETDRSNPQVSSKSEEPDREELSDMINLLEKYITKMQSKTKSL